jgi:hypothetical protein
VLAVGRGDEVAELATEVLEGMSVLGPRELHLRDLGIAAICALPHWLML